MTEKNGRCKDRRLGWVMLAAVLLGGWGLFFSAFMADDFILLGTLEKVSPLPGRAPFFLYTLADGNPQNLLRAKAAGALPWFFSPRFKMKFFRPLSSLLLTLDHCLFGLHPLGYTLHTLLWYLLLVGGAARLFKKTLERRIAFRALLVFSISGILAVNLFWSSSRHILVAIVLGVWSLLAFIAWREKKKISYLLLASAGYLLALLAGEAGLATLAYPVAYVLLAWPGERRPNVRPLSPLLFLAVAYLVFYFAQGYGAMNGSGYIAPLNQPLSFILSLPLRLLGLAGGVFLGGVTEMLAMNPAGQTLLVLAGLSALLFFYRPWRSLRTTLSPGQNYALDWFAAGAALSCLPFAAADVSAFRLIVPFLGAAVIIAHFLRQQEKPTKKAVPWLLLALFHLLLAPLQRLGSPPLLKQFMNTRLESAMNGLDHDFPRLADKRVIILNAPDLALGFHPYFYRRLFRRSMPRSWQILSWGAGEQRIERIDARTFSVVFIGRGLPARTFVPDDRVVLPGMEITVRDVDHSAIHFFQCRLERSADDGEWLFLHWKENRFQRMNMPPSGHSANLHCDPPTLRP